MFGSRRRASVYINAYRGFRVAPVHDRYVVPQGPNRMKNRLRALRAEPRWTEADLAEALNVSRQAINAVETGKYAPSLPLAFATARLFGQVIEEIFQYQAEPAAPSGDPAPGIKGSSAVRKVNVHCRSSRCQNSLRSRENLRRNRRSAIE